jgi:hypothetical protein
MISLSIFTVNYFVKPACALVCHCWRVTTCILWTNEGSEQSKCFLLHSNRNVPSIPTLLLIVPYLATKITCLHSTHIWIWSCIGNRISLLKMTFSLSFLSVSLYIIFSPILIRPFRRYRITSVDVNLRGSDGGIFQSVLPCFWTLFIRPHLVTGSVSILRWKVRELGPLQRVALSHRKTCICQLTAVAYTVLVDRSQGVFSCGWIPKVSSIHRNTCSLLLLSNFNQN